MRPVLRLWNRLSRLGIDARVTPLDEKHIVLANQIAVLVVGLNLLALTNPVMRQAPASAAMLVVAMLGHPVTLILNAAHRHFAARLFQGVWSIATTIAASLLLPREANASLILIPVATGVWLVAPRRDWKWAVAITVAAAASYLFLEARPGLGEDPVMDPALVAEFSRVNRFALFVLIVGVGVQAYVTTGRADALLQTERQKSRALLLNVLPTAIADRLLEKPGTIADRFDRATVLFADLANFTRLAERTAAPELVATLDAIFSAFDGLAEKHGLEKIKTIGDAYMAAGGVPARGEGHERAVAAMALEMIQVLPTLPGGPELALRIGIHTGPVVAGVIGRKKFSYDMWGDTVNTASRMESHGAPGRVHCTQEVRDALAGSSRSSRAARST